MHGCTAVQGAGVGKGQRAKESGDRGRRLYYQFMVSILAKWVQGSEEDCGLIIQAHVEFGQLNMHHGHIYTLARVEIQMAMYSFVRSMHHLGAFIAKNPSGVGFSFRTVSRQSAITKPTRPGRANEEEAVYGGIAEPTGVERAERCTGTVHGCREGAGRGPGQRAITVHGDGKCREGTGAESE